MEWRPLSFARLNADGIVVDREVKWRELGLLGAPQGLPVMGSELHRGPEAAYSARTRLFLLEGQRAWQSKSGFAFCRGKRRMALAAEKVKEPCYGRRRLPVLMCSLMMRDRWCCSDGV